MRENIPFRVIAVLFALLAAGLFYTQIIRFGYYSRLSKNNSIRVIPIDGPRGNIFDRRAVMMVTSRLSFDVAVIYNELRDRAGIERLLADVTGAPREQIGRSLDKARARSYSPVPILRDIGKEKAIAIEEESSGIEGLIVETRSKRDYLYGQTGSHLFGCLGEITEDELEVLKDYGYRMKDLLGRDGLEKYYENDLKGLDGGVQIQVDNKGRQVKVLGLKEPTKGSDLYLTIDAALQSASDKLLGPHRGAVIAIDPRNGQVLALVSHPSFDPNIFVRPDDSAQRSRLLNDRTARPLLNRAIAGIYPPGSVFKIVTASAALEGRRINQNTRFVCSGSYHLGNATFDCWKEGGHGSQNIIEGFINSCNVFFYNTGRLAGADQIEAFAKLFGFGRVTGIDLPGEAKGIAPGKIWKRLRKNEGWYEGDTLNYSIGQGYLLVTPIQVLDMMCVIANRGSLVKPSIVMRIGNAPVSTAKPKSIGLKESTASQIRKGLFEVVNAEGGTGRRAMVEGVKVAGKTGTAQNPQGSTHAWFAGFAPYDDPKICLVVFLEHGGKGGLEPAQIARAIFEEAKNKGYI